MRGSPTYGKRARAPSGVCLIVRAEAHSGAGEELAALLSQLAEEVLDSEADCSSYVVTRMMGSSEHFAVHARFTSWEAFNAHAETEHLTRLLPQLTALLATPISMEIFLELPGRRRAFRIDDARGEVEAERQRK